ncbi:iron-containing alcohol dehydrogenase [Tateyamaria omphalii]|uniref:iron-containing alcohol dehydrogenase n=1 Tax=Tateyamaria omphalii TaxID=299262 RepID=UPI0016772591|nr:iron-containing alcohol dehydrogenase [Tateyamaria omphalii]
MNAHLGGFHTRWCKFGLWGEELMFAQAVLDPELIVSLPPHLAAWTGVDAMAHALEGAIARTTGPAGLLHGLEALCILSGALRQAAVDGSNTEMRGCVLWGRMVADLALHNCNTHIGHNVCQALAPWPVFIMGLRRDWSWKSACLGWYPVQSVRPTKLKLHTL